MAEAGAAAGIATGVNIGMRIAQRSPLRNRPRDVVDKDRKIPWHRAVALAWRCPTKLSSTIHSLAASLQSRRRMPSVTERTSISGLNVRADVSLPPETCQAVPARCLQYSRCSHDFVSGDRGGTVGLPRTFISSGRCDRLGVALPDRSVASSRFVRSINFRMHLAPFTPFRRSIFTGKPITVVAKTDAGAVPCPAACCEAMSR